MWIPLTGGIIAVEAPVTDIVPIWAEMTASVIQAVPAEIQLTGSQKVERDIPEAPTLLNRNIAVLRWEVIMTLGILEGMQEVDIREAAPREGAEAYWGFLTSLRIFWISCLNCLWEAA